ncbi:HGGxSTG domain-containing protein [Bradyrhizobium sp. S3.5.5]|uniref:HGGxSTG domain-containing protein n=1 Tax=Bradyrhizobium sp. S3.5.5 TaxID=3156430 RepID=UPI00339760AD
MLASPRCGARTRSGSACLAPAVHGKTRCRMHGSAARSGAPKGNQNARKHGLFTGPDRRTKGDTGVAGRDAEAAAGAGLGRVPINPAA